MIKSKFTLIQFHQKTFKIIILYIQNNYIILMSHGEI